MSRKELYNKIKEKNAAEAIKKKFGDNYTRISNADLEEFLKGFGKKPSKKAVTPKKEKRVEEVIEVAEFTDCPIAAALVKLLSILQANKIVTAKEAEDIVSLL